MKDSSILEASSPAVSGSALAALWSALRSALRSVRIERRTRRLRLCETLPLGEKRLIAVVEFEQQRFLLAATAERISLLQTLGSASASEGRPAERA